jgi:hypothetical protein
LVRQRTLVCAATLALIFLWVSLPALGCNDGGSGESMDTKAVAMMHRVPSSAETYVLLDYGAFRIDDDLHTLFEGVEEISSVWDVLGIPDDEVELVAVAGEVIVLEGDFDLEEVREALKDAGLGEDDYGDGEVWAKAGGAVVLEDATCIAIIVGNDVEECVDVVLGRSTSLYEDVTARDVVGRVPDSVVVVYATESEGVFTEEDYEGLEATAMSFGKKEPDSLNLTAVFGFEDDEAARTALDDVKDDMAKGDDVEVRNVRVTREGSYVSVRGEIDVDDFDSLMD